MAALQLAEDAIAADNRFDRNEINQVVPVIRADGVSQSDQPTRLSTPKAGRRNRPNESTTDAPYCLISAHSRANPIRCESTNGVEDQNAADEQRR